MATTTTNLGFGSTLAPVGTPEWAKRWLIEFQTVAKSLPDAPQVSRRFYELGKKHRAWTMLADSRGKPFPDFDAFCACPEPWGLGMDPAKFRAYLEAEIGKREADLITVSPDTRSAREHDEEGHFEPANHSRNHCGNGTSPRKQEALRAINRAPEIVQTLYREGCITQTDAAKLGPKEPSPERAAQVATVRQELAELDRSLPKPELRKQVRAIIKREMGGKEKTTVDILLAAWEKATESERA